MNRLLMASILVLSSFYALAENPYQSTKSIQINNMIKGKDKRVIKQTLKECGYKVTGRYGIKSVDPRDAGSFRISKSHLVCTSDCPAYKYNLERIEIDNNWSVSYHYHDSYRAYDIRKEWLERFINCD